VEECSKERFCAFQSGECINKEMLCNGKSKFNLIRTKSYWKFEKAKQIAIIYLTGVLSGMVNMNAFHTNYGVCEKVNLISSNKHYYKLIKGEKKCSEDNLCTIENGECISNVFLCNRKGKFNVFTYKKHYWKLLKGKEECSKEKKCFFTNGKCLEKRDFCWGKNAQYNYTCSNGKSCSECIQNEIMCSGKGKFNFFTK
jgi:hypothetical protein